MIVFDLRCASAGHVFEAWFGSSDDYDGQRARGLIACPICGDADVAKAVMAPNVAPKGNSRSEAATQPVAMPAAGPVPPEAAKAMLHAMAQVQARLLEGSQWVGRKFADQARAIHHGEQEAAAIHGEATPAEAEALIDEGIAVAPLPFPVAPPETHN
jgi:hypothetical protein